MDMKNVRWGLGWLEIYIFMKISCVENKDWKLFMFVINLDGVIRIIWEFRRIGI